MAVVDEDLTDWFQEATGFSRADYFAAPAPAAAAIIERVPHPKASRYALKTIVFIIVANLGLQFGLLATAHADHWSSADGLRTSLLAGAAFYVLIGALVVIRAETLAVRPVWLAGPARTAVGYGAAVGGSTAILVSAIGTLAAGHPSVDAMAGAVAGNTSLLLLAGGFFVMAIAAPVAEEYVFRGFLAESLRGRGRKAALLLSAAAFSLAHLRFAQFRYFLAMGVAFGALYWGRGLVASISAHAAFNGMLVVLAVASVHGPARVYDAGAVELRLPATWHQIGAPAHMDFAAMGPGSAQLAVGHVDIPAGVTLTADRMAAVLSSGSLPVSSALTVDTSSIKVRSDVPLGPAVTAHGIVGGHSDDAVMVVSGNKLLMFEIVGGRDNRASSDIEQMLHSARAKAA